MSEMFRPPQGPCYADLEGKVALVTGGGAGIGRGISLRLAAEKMRVFLCGRTEETLLESAAAIADRGGSATPIVADLSHEGDIARLFERVQDEAGRLDVLVHNAALVRGGPLTKTDVDYWRTMFATNVESAFHLAKRASEMMIPQGAGAMVFVSTVGAVQAHHDMLAYDSSKGAIDSMVRSLALELAQYGIRVNGIAPGATMNRAFDDEIPADRMRQPYVPLGRRGTPAEMASAVAFLAGGQASYIAGQILCVDGGATAQLSPRGVFI